MDASGWVGSGAAQLLNSGDRVREAQRIITEAEGPELKSLDTDINSLPHLPHP